MVGSQMMKMREILEKIVELTAPCEGVTSIELQVQAEALTALSEPPRNCDTGKDAKTLLDDYISIKRFSSDNQIRALYDLALPVIVWLLAPSAERKGEADGSK